MSTETLTPRERWQGVLSRQPVDRIPMDYWSTPEFSARLVHHLGVSRLSEAQLLREFYAGSADSVVCLRAALQKLHVDFVVAVGPDYVGPALTENTDVFGCISRDIDYGTGRYSEVINHPLAGFHSVEQIEAGYTWPDPDWWDYRDIPRQVAGWQDYPIRGGGSEPFLIYKNLRGDEQAMIDLVENPEVVHYCLGKLFDLAYQNTLRIYETIPGQVLVTYVAEDMGGQDNLMFSRKHILAYLLPGMQRMIDLAHQAGAVVFHHNDGNCRKIIPDMIAAGINVLNPIQWRSKGMEREGLKADFGDQLIFHGAVDNQYTLPFGSVEEVRQEVYDNLRILGEGGGYILAPCHNIQPVTPVENVIAMYDACYHA